MKPILLGLTLALLAGCASSSPTNAIPTATSSASSSRADLSMIMTDATDATMPDLSGTAIHSYGIDAWIDHVHDVGYINVATCYASPQATNCGLVALKTLSIQKGLIGLFTGKDATGKLCGGGKLKPGTYHPHQRIPYSYVWTGKC
jgi:hypothetical protein